MLSYHDPPWLSRIDFLPGDRVSKDLDCNPERRMSVRGSVKTPSRQLKVMAKAKQAEERAERQRSLRFREEIGRRQRQAAAAEKEAERVERINAQVSRSVK